MITVKSFGGADTVTGSQHLVELSKEGPSFLVDAGLFQGEDESVHHNSPKLSYEPSMLKAIFLTHAHLDHCGLLPLLCKNGFSGPIITTQTTRELAEIVLRDAAKIAQGEASSFNKKITKASLKKEPLYRTQDVERAINLMKVHPVGEKKGTVSQIPGLTFQFFAAGHIPGAVSVAFNYQGSDYLFSGDLGRDDDPLVRAPFVEGKYDHIFVESTYGGHIHPRGEIYEQLARLIKKVKDSGGVLLIPAFSVARSQMIALILHKLFKKSPDLKLPVAMDSPMGLKVNKVFERHPEELAISLDDYREIFNDIQEIEEKWQEDRLASNPGAHIIISSSGMMTGGKVLGHFSRLALDPDNIIFLPGFLSPKTLGARLVSGERTFSFTSTENATGKAEREEITVVCQIENNRELSAHADQEQITKWLEQTLRSKEGSTVHLIHGEEEARLALRDHLNSVGIEKVELQNYN